LYGWSEKDRQHRDRRVKRTSNEEREDQIRAHVAEVIELRLAELKAEGRPVSYEKAARAMGEYGKEAVLRIVAKERPLQPGLLERLARALGIELVQLLAPVLGPDLTKAEVDKRLANELATLARIVTALGQDAIKDSHVVDAIRALGAIDDKAKRRQLAEFLLAVARDHERMTGARRLLVGPPSRSGPAQQEARRQLLQTTTKSKGAKKR
jgi:hypothetical protein